ncbi:MAG TPA: sigma-70 family RNA polymerase sigma factor, partial [Polyangium sp.]|nr:sigma-70 family RNA polymerase sigma factor [Polyangium sp.]
EFAALSNRKSKHQRLLGEGHSEEELGALKTTPGHEDAVAARQLLQRALPLLNPEQLALVNAVHFEGKTLKEIADEKKLPQSTVGSRYHRALQILREAIEAMLATLGLFYATKLRALGSHVVRSAAQLVPQATQSACAMAVTAACGVLVPANAVGTVVRPDVPIALRLAPRTLAITANMRPMSPLARQEVEPVKPNGVDTAPVECSGAGMKPTTIARYVQDAVLPFAFLLAPAVTSVACAGTERQTPPPQQADDEEEGGLDPYYMMCLNATRMGADCPTRAEWYKSMGRCPDGQKGCQD